MPTLLDLEENQVEQMEQEMVLGMMKDIYQMVKQHFLSTAKTENKDIKEKFKFSQVQ